MTKLFKKKDPSELRSVARRIRLTEEEDKKIRHSASIRQMDISEFIRRAALGRKANVDYETEIVLALSDVTRVIRGLHAALVERGITPPEDEWRPVILDARAAILRISK
ncbi:hypothetical protein QN379_09835 [Glaciimonas sp. Gout2]|uniref:plasmid mobilization protein n=1 Tax=Glaciimonas sp. Gout2 TaxID=3048625 RepID=UPI002B23D370|nr:hypothetical protein [Glaciimonas sp. Gout2]MEB0082315.1 hypothetical protein [Glaciimonas sp. Gout2]